MHIQTGGLSIGASQINAVQNANDRDQIGSTVSRVWDKIVDWFSGSHREEAKQCLFDLYHPFTPDQQKIASFERLRELAGEGFQDRFRAERNENGETFILGLELEHEGINNYTLHRQQIVCEPHVIKRELEMDIQAELEAMRNQEPDTPTRQRGHLTADLTRGHYSVSGQVLPQEDRLAQFDAALNELGCTLEERAAIHSICHQGLFAIITLDAAAERVQCPGDGATHYDISRREDGTIQIRADHNKDIATAREDQREAMLGMLHDPLFCKSYDAHVELSVLANGTVNVESVDYLVNHGLNPLEG